MRFIFKQENRNNWPNIIHNLHVTLSGNKKDDMMLELKEYQKRRSGAQLRAYWVLINCVRDWMNEKGNCFSKDHVSDYFKIKAGHCTEINKIITPDSIANKSDCTKEIMERIINSILSFGAENDIENCFIEDRELDLLLNFYSEK